MKKEITICAVGDIMPGGIYSASGKEINIEGSVKKYIDSADIRLATLESAIGNQESFIEGKVSRLGDIVYSKEEDLLRLLELNINVVNLANNHIFDLGGDNIIQVIASLDKIGIKHFGAGKDLTEAKKPAVFEINGKKIAIIGFCDWRDETTGWCLMATESAPGVNPLYGDYEKQILELKVEYDYVVAVPHWGIEHIYWPTNHVVRHAKKMIRAGADIIIGGHTHRPQPIIRYRKKIIAYSLGNFFFADRLINVPRSSWYPQPDMQNIDYRFIERTEGYPYVKSPTLVTFPEEGKEGEILNISIQNAEISAEYNIVYYSSSNAITLQNNFSNQTREKLYVIGLLTRLPIYSAIVYPSYKFIHKLKRGILFRFLKLFSSKSFNSI